MRFVKEVFPRAHVTARCEGFGLVRIQESCGRAVVQVEQRDLYRKYKWPAKHKIIQALERLKMAM